MMKLPSLTRTNLANLMARRWRRSDGGNGGGDNAASQVATVQTDVRSFRAEAAAAAAEEVEEETIWNHPLFRLVSSPNHDAWSYPPTSPRLLTN